MQQHFSPIANQYRSRECKQKRQLLIGLYGLDLHQALGFESQRKIPLSNVIHRRPIVTNNFVSRQEGPEARKTHHKHNGSRATVSAPRRTAIPKMLLVRIPFLISRRLCHNQESEKQATKSLCVCGVQKSKTYHLPALREHSGKIRTKQTGGRGENPGTRAGTIRMNPRPRWHTHGGG